jgi:cell pole-organizing protein PopZ
MPDVAPEQSMDEILHKLQREYTDEGKQKDQATAPAPRSAEVLNLSEATSDNRKSRSSTRNAVPPQPEAEAANSGPSEILMAGAAGEGAATALAQLAAIQRERRRASEFPMGDIARTLEDVARDALRPMLQCWLDEKLPGLLERLVKAELSRVIGETV